MIQLDSTQPSEWVAPQAPQPGANPGAPTVAWFAISAAVRPAITQALAVGDCVRRAMMAHSDGHPTFVGRQDDQPRTGHRHAFFLPADHDGDARLDRLIICARDGFDERALRALERLHRAPVWGTGGPELWMTWLATGSSNDVGGLVSESRSGRAAQLGTARIWESHTPFVPPRFPRRRGGQDVDTVEEQARRLLATLGLPPPATITPIRGQDTPAGVPWERFLLRRPSGGGAHGLGRGHGLRLAFDRPVRGPIALGYGAHHGLGQFVAVAR
jgi:CRISPR-associated protein Csb2